MMQTAMLMRCMRMLMMHPVMLVQFHRKAFAPMSGALAFRLLRTCLQAFCHALLLRRYALGEFGAFRLIRIRLLTCR